ncbi:MAG: archaemetzincin family Zn-dependent metalloprotease [Candidatus Caldarchaeum sp.]
MHLKVLNTTSDKSIAAAVAEKIQEIYRLQTTVQETFLTEMEKAYNPARRQYDVSILMNYVKPKEGYELIITDKDLYVPGLNFVFGYAPGRGAIVSIYRLRSRDESLTRERAVKEAVHEVGHLLGLRHCSTQGCVMNFSNSVYEVDSKGEKPCHRCLSKIISS